LADSIDKQNQLKKKVFIARNNFFFFFTSVLLGRHKVLSCQVDLSFNVALSVKYKTFPVESVPVEKTKNFFDQIYNNKFFDAKKICTLLCKSK
jgi:hypothetical protein